MTDLHTCLSYDPNRLLDSLAAWMNVSGDKTLSRKLGLSTGVLRNLRCGRVSMRPSILVAMADCAGRSVEELRRVLGDRRSKARMVCALAG